MKPHMILLTQFVMLLAWQATLGPRKFDDNERYFQHSTPISREICYSIHELVIQGTHAIRTSKLSRIVLALDSLLMAQRRQGTVIKIYRDMLLLLDDT